LGVAVGVALVSATLAAPPATPGGSTGPRIGPTLGGAPTADLSGLLQRQGLLDPNKLTTWRSYSFGVTTGGGHTSSGALLVQHMHYQLSKPLSLYMEVGLQHDPLGMAGVGNDGARQASLTIPSLELIYRPTDNVIFSVQYSQRDGNYGDPWGRSGRDPWWTRVRQAE